MSDLVTCSLCLESFGEETTRVARFQARQYYYHENCLLSWLEQARRCPPYNCDNIVLEISHAPGGPIIEQYEPEFDMEHRLIPKLLPILIPTLTSPSDRGPADSPTPRRTHEEMVEEWASEEGWSLLPPVVNDEEGGSGEGNHVEEPAGPASAAGPAGSSQTHHVEDDEDEGTSIRYAMTVLIRMQD